MIILLSLVCVGLWLTRRVVRKRYSRQSYSQRVSQRAIRKRKLAAFFMTAAILGMQSIVTAPPAFALKCGEAPNPERPGAGFVGKLDPPAQHGLEGSAYLDYSYAGMVWHSYTPECSPLSNVIDADFDTWAGNHLFNVAKVIVAATNGLHYATLVSPFESFSEPIKKLTGLTFDNVFVQLVGLLLIIVSIVILRYVMKGNLAAVGKRSLYVLLGLWLAASSAVVFSYMGSIDKFFVDATNELSLSFFDTSDENLVQHEVLPTTLHNVIVYNNWVEGSIGPRKEKQEEFGRKLLDAQAFTWTQLNSDQDTDQAAELPTKIEY